MKVKDLIAALQKANPEVEIAIHKNRGGVKMAQSYRIVTYVDVLDADCVIAAARQLDPEIADDIFSVEDALAVIYGPGVVPLDNGFETVSRHTERKE